MLQARKKFWGKKPGFDSGDVLHIGVNVLFVAVIYSMVAYWELAALAIVLVFLSKWRIFAVQPRFWLPNMRANMVDLIVGISTVILMFQAPHPWLAVMWAVLYLAWLLFLKPQSLELWVGLQAFWAQFLGIVAVFTVATFVDIPFIVCALVWLVAWAAARHFFTNYEEPHYRTLGLTWGFLMSQLAWVSLHWIQYYQIFNVKIALIAVIISVLSAGLGSVYHSYKTDTLHKGVLLENGLFTGSLLIIVVAMARWVARL